MKHSSIPSILDTRHSTHAGQRIFCTCTSFPPQTLCPTPVFAAQSGWSRLRHQPPLGLVRLWPLDCGDSLVHPTLQLQNDPGEIGVAKGLGYGEPSRLDHY